MTKAKHTQGPWEVGADQDGMLVKDSDGDTICSIYHWQGVYKAQANAHLIAAAPDMLEALELADKALSGANMNLKLVEKKVKTAIAKAKGE